MYAFFFMEVLGVSSGVFGSASEGPWGFLGDPRETSGGSSGALGESLGGQEFSFLIAWGVSWGPQEGPGDPKDVLRGLQGGLGRSWGFLGVLGRSQGRRKLWIQSLGSDLGASAGSMGLVLGSSGYAQGR